MKTRTHVISTHLFLFLLGFAVMATSQAQDVQVNSADPSSAVQGTIDLDVEIAGSGFDNSAVVDFFVTGTTNPGGITVKKVKTRGSKKIIATINVADTATVVDFDIEVSLSSGRKGKGTTLFSVKMKPNGDPCVEGDSRPKCADDPPPAGLTYTVEMDGAFVMDQLTTSDGNELLGDAEFTIYRPGNACTTMTEGSDERKACETWGTVFDVCGIYDIHGPDPYGPEQFTTTPDRKGKVQWAIYKYRGGVRVFLITSIQNPSDPLNPWGVVLQLDSDCVYHTDDFPGRPLCGTFLSEDEENPTTEFKMNHFWNHAGGKKGAAHAETCHVGEGALSPSHSTLTITAQ
jgi:hypothetical protein